MHEKEQQEAKKVVIDAKFKAYNNRLEIREGEKDIFKTAKIREENQRLRPCQMC